MIQMAAHSSRHAQVHADAVESVYGFRHYQHKHAGHNTKQAMKGAGLYRDRNVDLALTVTGNLFRCYTGTIDDGECGRPASDTCFSVVFSAHFNLTSFCSCCGQIRCVLPINSVRVNVFV